MHKSGVVTILALLVVLFALLPVCPELPSSMGRRHLPADDARRDTGEDHEGFLKRLAQGSGIATATRAVSEVMPMVCRLLRPCPFSG